MREILSKALQGDKSAEEEFFRILRVRFTGLAKLTMTEENAEDAAQEACLTVLQKYRSLPDYENVMAWAHTVLRNKIGNYLNRNKRWRKVMAGYSSDNENLTFSQPIPDPILEQAIIRCLKSLREKDDRYVRILNLLHQGYETEEICSRLDITRNHLYVLLNRARAMLADCLEGRSA